MLRHRPADLDVDREALLEFHCLGNYHSDSPWARTMPYEDYRDKWLSTSQPAQFLAAVRRSLDDARTIVEIWEDGDSAGLLVPVAFLWLGFTDMRDYEVAVAEVNDIAVAPERQGEGLGRAVLRFAEQQARVRGANILRSETGVENLTSQGLHQSEGFETYRYLYEKRLD
jgi:GNAT superfamily N-acetyltransferase